MQGRYTTFIAEVYLFDVLDKSLNANTLDTERRGMSILLLLNLLKSGVISHVKALESVAENYYQIYYMSNFNLFRLQYACTVTGRRMFSFQIRSNPQICSRELYSVTSSFPRKSFWIKNQIYFQLGFYTRFLPLMIYILSLTLIIYFIKIEF